MTTLLMLNVPPPYGGGELRGAEMANYFIDKEDCVVYSFNRVKASKNSQGRFTMRNIVDGFRWLIQGIRLIQKNQPSRLFLSIPKNTSAFLRLIPLLHYANWRGIRIYGELAGARFQFLEKSGITCSIGLRYLRMFHSIRFLGLSILNHHSEYGISNPVAFDNGISAPAPVGNEFVRAKSRPLKLLYVGVLNRTKGISELIEAVELLLESGVNVQCTLVGEWGDFSLQQEISLKLKSNPVLSSRLEFTGRLNADAKWKKYYEAALLVHPTRWDGQPLTILEALAMGLGIVSTKIGAIPDTISDLENGRVLPNNSPSAIADAISQYYQNPQELAIIMQRNRMLYEERFTMSCYLSNVDKWLNGSVSEGE